MYLFENTILTGLKSVSRHLVDAWFSYDSLSNMEAVWFRCLLVLFVFGQLHNWTMSLQSLEKKHNHQYKVSFSASTLDYCSNHQQSWETNREWYEEAKSEAGAHSFLAQTIDSCSQSVTVVVVRWSHRVPRPLDLLSVKVDVKYSHGCNECEGGLFTPFFIMGRGERVKDVKVNTLYNESYTKWQIFDDRIVLCLVFRGKNTWTQLTDFKH